MEQVPTLNSIRLAHDRIKTYAHQTPVMTSESLNYLVGASLFFKCENLQKTGAFKFRGACNAVFSLSDELAKEGVVTHSSGNHGQALALAAKFRGIKARIIMPEDSSEVKVAAVKSYGGEIIFCEGNLKSREDTLEKVLQEKGGHLVHPYDDYRVIAGQSTAALELLEEIKDLETIIAPVGGGGLLSGTGLSAFYTSPTTEVIGAEPLGADDAFRSLEAGEIIPNTNPKTMADGLKASLSERTFSIIQKRVKKIICVKEESIVEAMRLIWERLKVLVEPSGAVPLAAVLENKEEFRKRRVGIILSGGNFDFTKFKWL